MEMLACRTLLAAHGMSATRTMRRERPRANMMGLRLGACFYRRVPRWGSPARKVAIFYHVIRALPAGHARRLQHYLPAPRASADDASRRSAISRAERRLWDADYR